MRRVRLWLVLVLVLSSHPATAPVLGKPLQGKINALLSSKRIKSDQVGMLIVDLNTHETLAGVNPTRAMIPASNLKLVTTAAALGVLGPDFVFQTRLRVIHPADWPDDADLGEGATPYRKSVVIVVQGDGDPAFVDPVLMERYGYGQDVRDIEQFLQLWVRAIQRTGVKRVSRVFVDDRVFDRKFVHPTWPINQLNSWYSAQVAGFNFYDNCIEVFASPAAHVGQSPSIRISPIMPFLRTSNNALTGATDTFWINRQPNSNRLIYAGNVKNERTKPVLITMHDPPMLFAEILKDRLESVGIEVEGFGRPDEGQQLPQGRIIHIVQTDLPTVITRCNKQSQNLYAEALIKRMGRHITGAPGSWETGAAAVRQFLQKKLGTRASAIRIADGSGLSRDNRISADAMVELLSAMHDDPTLGPIFLQSLAIGGRDGTLAKRFRHTPLEGVVHAKTGYINRVSTLSGYYILPAEKDTQEHVVAFSFLFNNFKPPVHVHNVKQLQEDLVGLIDDYIESSRERATASAGG